MEFYDLSNLDIKMTYIVNENKTEKEWMSDIFVQTKFFAESRAKKYKIILPLEDLFQEAYLGLWEAILTYDYQKNFDFYRWAQWNISKKLRDCNAKSKRFFDAKSNIKKELTDYDSNGVLCSEEVGLEMNILCKTLLSEKKDLLTKRENQVLVDNLILCKTLREIATNFNLSTERIRQVKNCGLNKIKNLL